MLGSHRNATRNNRTGSTMCGQHKIQNGRRWVCIRDEHPTEPDNHRYVSPDRAKAVQR